MVLARSMSTIPAAYLGSHALSILGNSIAAVALPLIILQATGSALNTGVVAASAAVPAVLAGVLGGALIDRFNRRTVSVTADLVSAAAVAALPLVDLLWGLNLGWFVLLGIIGALGDVPGMTAREALLPAVVRHSGVAAERLVGLREALAALMIVVGPAAAGTLMSMFSGSTVLWITAATSLAAALLTLVLPHEAGDAGESPAIRSADPTVAAGTVPAGPLEVLAGWRFLRSSPVMAALTVVALASVAVLAALQGVILPVHFHLAGNAGLLGFVLSALAAGTLVGAGLYAGLGSRGTKRGWFAAGTVGAAVGVVLIAPLPAPGLIVGAAVVVGAGSGVLGAVTGVLTLDFVPDAVRGRVMGTQNAVLMVAGPLGVLGGALIIEAAGPTTAAVAVAGLWLAAAGALICRPLRRLEPDPAAEPRNVGQDRVNQEGAAAVEEQ